MSRRGNKAEDGGDITKTLVINVDRTTDANNTLKERQLMGHQFMCCLGDCSYELVGDGDPHTDFLHRQLTEKLECRDGPEAKDCSIGFSQGHTFGYVVSTGAKVGFFNPGFAVTESWTVSEVKTCGAHSNGTVCLKYDMAYTAYTVQVVNKHRYSSVCSTQSMGPIVVRAPNKNNVGGGHFYCAYGDECKELGDEKWCLTNDCPVPKRGR
ncbi:hypothetical protein BDV28DRAFT_162764 [Aspergillus coremiiformis]|uniref:Uncharacterized protein n=1 Tax=Aspergillus coremiiformis TaxID=138285 RepID=A0A5N6YZG3_9EURO|nr:hypothetical protein BDV28DRAFT_162764 [Aspergillus coremiiformis]